MDGGAPLGLVAMGVTPMKHAAIAVVLTAIFAFGWWGPTDARPAASDCDRYAADPDDLARVVEGVADDAILPALAIPACEAAVKAEPDNVRYVYQFARALRAGRRFDEAREQFATAQKMSGHSGAIYYLALDRVQDYWTVVNTNHMQAHEILAEVRASLEPISEYEPATGLLHAITIRPGEFRLATVVGALMNGDYARLNRARMLVAIWAQGVHESVAMLFNPTTQDLPGAVAQPQITRPLDSAELGDPSNPAMTLLYKGGKYLGTWGLLVKDPVWLGDEKKWREWIKSIGIHDGLTLSNRLSAGERANPAVHEFYQHLVYFAMDPLPLSEYWRDMGSMQSVRDLFPEVMPFVEGEAPPASPSGD